MSSVFGDIEAVAVVDSDLGIKVREKCLEQKLFILKCSII